MTHSTSDTAPDSSQNSAREFGSRLGGLEIVRIVRRHLGLALLVFITGLGITAASLAYQVPTYAANSAILLRSWELPSETAGPELSSGTVSSTQVFTEAEVLRSREFASQLAARLDLIDDPRFNPALAEPRPPTLLDRLLSALGLEASGSPSDMPRDQQRARVLAKLLDMYTVSASEQHNVINIRAEHEDPALTSVVANAIAELYIKIQTDELIKEIDRDTRFLHQRIEEVATNLVSSQTNVSRLMLDNQLLDQSSIRTLLAEKTRLRNRLEASLAQDVDASQLEELEERIDEIDEQLAVWVGAEIRLSESQTALQAETSRLETLRKRLDELEAQRESPRPNAAQISVAEVPSTPFSPNVSSTMAIAAVIFAFLGIVVALLREGLDNRVLHQADAENLTGLSVLASLPWIPKKLLRRYRAPHACVANDASRGYANGVRALVSAAMNGANSGRASIVCISSGKSAEGKSSVAAAMGVAAAIDDLRVLLIDSDVYRFGLTRMLGMQPGQLAFGEVFSSHEAFTDAVQKSQYGGVDLLTFRPGCRMSRRALGSPDARDILESLRGTYDLVIIDTPPYLAFEEAGRLHGIVDKAILVHRWGEASSDTLGQTARLMRRSGLPLIGLVVNGINARSARSYGYVAYSDDVYRLQKGH